MVLLKLVLAYDGGGFRGFARQPGQRTIQGLLEHALETVLGARPRLSVAGRTDAGVHAEGQVVSFEADHDPKRLQRAVNGMLAPEVVVRSARPVAPGFDARHSATARRYRYRLRTSPWPDPFTARYEWHHPAELGVGRMRRAAKLLLGEHDFASFCRAPADGASTTRTLRRLTVRPSHGVVEVWAEADAFLHQMVRSLVGTLVKVGEGQIEPEWMPAILEARSRSAAGPVAPPDGLCLVAVRYGAIPKGRERSRTSGVSR
ncbi:MAG: tRNA pseudouridine(38-40) synthase TruA [Actinomycetota bacterium]|nr:tRNA pseudouridine(38-40) synthase TruA [Actinomycetota bacterium]